MVSISSMFDRGGRHKCIGHERGIRRRVRFDFVDTATVFGTGQPLASVACSLLHMLSMSAVVNTDEFLSSIEYRSAVMIMFFSKGPTRPAVLEVHIISALGA
jgi:hypothetical protein